MHHPYSLQSTPDHLHTAAPTVNPPLGILRCAKSFLGPPKLLTTYKAFVRSLMEYCKFQVNQMKIEDFQKYGPNWPFLTFWPMFTSKLIGGWIWRPDMQMLFKFQVNRMKIEDFRNTALVVDLGPMLTFWSMLISKIIGFFFCSNPFLTCISSRVNCFVML